LHEARKEIWNIMMHHRIHTSIFSSYLTLHIIIFLFIFMSGKHLSLFLHSMSTDVSLYRFIDSWNANLKFLFLRNEKSHIGQRDDSIFLEPQGWSLQTILYYRTTWKCSRTISNNKPNCMLTPSIVGNES